MIAAESQLTSASATGSGNASGARRIALTPSRAAVICLLVYLAIVMTEGFSRWVLSKVGAEPLLYVRELFPIAGILLSASMRGLGRRNFIFALLCLQLAIAAGVGFLHWGSIPQVAFGIKVFMPMLFGVAVYPAIIRNWEFFRRGCLILLLIVIFGVCLNGVVRYPWIGSDFTVGNLTVETSRDWAELDGRERLPGFSRASYDAASHIIYLTIVALCGMRGLLTRLLLAAASCGAMYLTTSKTPFACLLQVLVYYFLLEGVAALRHPAVGSAFGKMKLLVSVGLRLQILTFVIATVILPLNTTGMLNYLERDLREDSKFHLLSMQDRAANFWPIAMTHIERVGGPWWGAGAGGVGSSVALFGNTDLILSCDNAFIYAYGVFGIFFVPYLLLFLWFILTRRLLTLNGSALIGLVALAVCVQALTSNTFESINDCLFVGIIIAHTTYGWRMRNSPLGAPQLLASS